MAKKLYYKIGEACKLLGIQPYVLRFWETEFPFLKPTKSKSGQRVYQEPQLNLIRRIKELLYDEEYTIAGAKKKLEAEIEAGQLTVITEAETEKRTKVQRKPTRKKKTTANKASTREAPNAEAEAKKATEEAGAEQTKKVGVLRDGIREALDQCQEILARLQA